MWDKVVSTQSDDAWFEDYCRLALACDPPKLPERTMRLGAVQAGWFPTVPGVAHIFATGGTPLDRQFVWQIIATQLEGHGIQPAQYALDWDHSDTQLTKEVDDWIKTADVRYSSWQDIEAKAKRYLQGGKVHILRNGAQYIASHTEGDHGDYESEIQRLDPNSKSITMWDCSCPWNQFAFQRTRKWKRLEGRPCVHVLATFWLSQSMPLDEEIGPGSEGPQEPPGGSAQAIPALPEGVPTPAAPPSQFGQVPGGGTGMVPPAGTPGPAKPGAPNQVAPAPEPAGVVPGQAPEPQSLIPQYPHDPALQPAINPVSVPGQKPQTPLNPIQNPGGTFSHVHEAAETFVNGQMVRLKQADFGQSVGLNAGQTVEVPTNSIGEVMGTDPLGLVNVLFSGKVAEEWGNLQPHGVILWAWPNDLIAVNAQPPGPAVRRR